MCNPSRIAAILIVASIAIAGAMAGYAIVVIQGWRWRETPGIPIWMVAAGALLAVAIVVVAAALAEAQKCSRPPCTTSGDRLIAGLTVLFCALLALLAAGTLAALPSIIPGAGTAIHIVFGVSAIAAGVAHAVIALVLLPDLGRCHGRAATAVVVLTVLSSIGFMLLLVGIDALWGSAHLAFPFPHNPPDNPPPL